MKLWLAVLIALVVVGLVVLGVMLFTGYVPSEGFSHNGKHEVRFGLVFGIEIGLLFALGSFALAGKQP